MLHAASVLTAQVSPDARHFVSGGQETVAKFVSARTGEWDAPPLKFIERRRSGLIGARRNLPVALDRTDDMDVGVAPHLAHRL